MANNSIITVDVLNGYLSCKYKAYLQLSGQHGIKSDYEAMLVERNYSPPHRWEKFNLISHMAERWDF
jgi:hypothetical protein